MEVKVIEVIGGREALSVNDAMRLYNAIKAIHPNELFLIFDDLTVLTPTFLTWSVGKWINRYTYTGKDKDLGFKRLNFSTNNSLFQVKINDFVENHLMGQEYYKLAGFG